MDKKLKPCTICGNNEPHVHTDNETYLYNGFTDTTIEELCKMDERIKDIIRYWNRNHPKFESIEPIATKENK